MSYIAKFTATRSNGSEFLAKYDDGATEWISADTIEKLTSIGKIPSSAAVIKDGTLYVNIFGRVFKAGCRVATKAVVESKPTPAKVEEKPVKKKGATIKNPKVLAAIRAEKEKADSIKKATADTLSNRKVVRLNKKNFPNYFGNTAGNLYLYDKETKTFGIAESLTEDSWKELINSRIIVVFVEGSPLSSPEATKVIKEAMNKKSITQEVKDKEQVEMIDNAPEHYGSFYEGLGSSAYDFDATEYVNKKY